MHHQPLSEVAVAAQQDNISGSAVDEYSILHVLAGFFLTYVLHLSVGVSVVLHCVFELWQNSPAGYGHWTISRRFALSNAQREELLRQNRMNAAVEIVANSVMDTLLFTLGAMAGEALRDHQQAKAGKSLK